MRSSTVSQRNTSRLSKRLVLSYVLDWVVIIVAAVIATLFAIISPNKRPFSLGNPEISFPHTKGTVSGTVLVLVGLLAPAVIIVITCLLFVPGPTVPKSVPKSLIWKRKLWEWFTGWLGLGMSCAGTWLITSGLKNLVGKPRPDLLARCQPDLANFANYVLTGFPTTPLDSALVSAAICTQKDSDILDDGWRSFPSGHSSFSAAGLIYLSLFLASKLAITLPFLSNKAQNQSNSSFYTAFPSRASTAPISGHPILPQSSHSATYSKASSSNGIDHRGGITHGSNLDGHQISARNQAASPPVYLLALAFIPTGVAMYIAGTRYSDFRHHGFDILSGFFIGTVNAFWAFRYYHLPISRGAGWSWGPRSRTRSFWAGVGVGSYVGDEEGDRKRRDEEAAMEGVPMDDLGAEQNGARDRRDVRNTVGGSSSGDRF